ncbi:Rft protein-domain-containing protein [Podospora appendiculata]|uniref:Man(5)GlcNAc(2)-PP-dolichol translocation protein RFT1 n=1 Tax=Podospora appendiculata TaxID=314037 RepID=A0AAE0X269_9PEZI|nr:Rft protein-domain-containing protein [Podospora appendiculata]
MAEGEILPQSPSKEQKPHAAKHDNASSKPPEDAAAPSSTRAVRGASLLILLQVVSRAITFIANQLLLRFMTAQLLGVATQLEVYYLSVLFFARESLRVAIQRQGSSPSTKATTSTQAVVNLGYLSILLGIPLAALFGWLYLHSLSATTLASAPYLIPSLYIYALAAVTELLSEPAFVVMQRRLQFTTRATAESVATFLRCTVTLLTAMWSPASHLGVLPFALGQLTYGLGLLTIYLTHGSLLARTEHFSLHPTRLSPSSPDFLLSYFYRPTLNLASSMMAQSLVKHLLTQGDTFLVSVLSTPTAQGVYALANNYGGLLARLLFQPVEESSRSYFSNLLSPPTSRHSLSTASTSLLSIFKLYALLSLVITTLGPPAAPLLLSLVAGPQWASSGAGACLAAYMWYIPLLALNGVAEAFVASVASEAQVHRQSAWMGAFSVGFAGAGFVFLRVLDMGAVGLVLANGINMACRIVWCAVFIWGWFKGRGVQVDVLGALPRPSAVLAALVTAGVVRRVVGDGAEVDMGVKETLGVLVRVAGLAVPFVVVVLFSERHFLQSGYQSLVGKRQKAA